MTGKAVKGIRMPGLFSLQPDRLLKIMIQFFCCFLLSPVIIKKNSIILIKIPLERLAAHLRRDSLYAKPELCMQVRSQTGVWERGTPEFGNEEEPEFGNEERGNEECSGLGG